jgi:D-serine dehydratase
MTISETLSQKTLERLTQAVDDGEAWAVQAVLDRVAPKLKAITPQSSLDGELIQARILEIRDLEQRLLALEAREVN